MGSHILPVSMPRPASSCSISSSISTSTPGKMLLKSHEDGSGRFLITALPHNDAASMDIFPLLDHPSSFPSDHADAPGGGGTKGRRGFLGDPSSSSGAAHNGFQRDARDGASETFLLTRLGIKLLGCLGAGYRLLLRILSLGCYGTLLSPGFIQVAYYYYFSSQIIRGIVYGDQPRNRLDLYLPKNCDGQKPVVAFITGGAWIIGYKAWGTLLGKHLSESDIIVACIDYRNFPQGTISDMVKDASQGVSFICKNIAEYGGDPNRIFLMGQSAGAHIAACTLLDQAVKEAIEGKPISWSVSQMNAFFGLSGGYNLSNLVQHFHRRGLHSSLFLSIMEGEQSLHRFSPEVLVQDLNLRVAVSLLPPVIVFHGTADTSIPSDSSKSFADTLQKVGINAKSILYEGKNHTDLFLQDPMRGGEDELLKDLVSAINGHESRVAPQRRLVPEILLKMARRISPF